MALSASLPHPTPWQAFLLKALQPSPPRKTTATAHEIRTPKSRRFRRTPRFEMQTRIDDVDQGSSKEIADQVLDAWIISLAKKMARQDYAASLALGQP